MELSQSSGALRRWQISLILCGALLASLASPRELRAQTVEIHEEITSRLEQSSWLGPLKWAWRWAHVLGAEVNLAEFDGPMPLKGVLDVAYDQLSAHCIQLDFLIDSAELDKDADDSCLKCMIDLSKLPRRVTLHRLLVEALKQLPQRQATVLVRPTYLEITTVQAAQGRDRSFYFLGGAAPIAKVWLLLAALCTLLFLGLRAPGICRRSERKATGLLGLLARGGLVFLFWPVWLVACGVALLRDKSVPSSTIQND